MRMILPGPVAPWRQIHADLLRQIETGELPAGGRLPSIVTLAQDYGVALTTVRKALDVLKADGLVVTSPMGTFVTDAATAPPRGRVDRRYDPGR